MVNLQLSIKEFQEEYNSNYEKLEELERNYNIIQELGKREGQEEAEIRYSIEIKKLKVRNQIIKSGIESLKNEWKQIQALSNRYQVTPKVENITVEELNICICRTQEELVEQYRKLDSFLTRQILGQRLSVKILDILIQLWPITFIMFVSFVSLFIRWNILEINALFDLGFSFVLSSSIIGFSYIKSKKRSQKLFQRLSHEFELGNSFYEDTYEQRYINQMIDSITKIFLGLQEQKRMLEIKKEECFESQKDNEIQSVQMQPQEITISQYTIDENYGKQKCKQ